MSCLAVIPARGGSKGIKLKNLRAIDGKSLVARAIETCQASQLFTEIYISTDNKKIANEAAKYGVPVNIFRPKELSRFCWRH